MRRDRASGGDPRPGAVGKVLGLREVIEREKGVFPDHEGNAVLLESCREPIMAIAGELESERTPGGNAETTKAELLIDEIEVVVEALAGIVLEESVSRLLVIPWLIARAGLHGGKDMNKTDIVSPLLRISLIRFSFLNCFTLRMNSISRPFSSAMCSAFSRTSCRRPSAKAE